MVGGVTIHKKTPFFVYVISDRAAWADQLVERCQDLDLVFERHSWSRASRLARPADAMILDVERRLRDVEALLAEWAKRVWQPLCIISLSTEAGNADFQRWLREHGYPRVVPATGLPGYWLRLRNNLEAVLEGGGRLVPLAAQYCGSSDPELVEALTLAAEHAAKCRTVSALCEAMGYSSPKPLRALFARHGCPTPKKVLQRLRLGWAVDYARRTEPTPTQGQVAEEFDFSSGKYLGRIARKLTGQSFEQLVTAGLEAVFPAPR